MQHIFDEDVAIPKRKLCVNAKPRSASSPTEQSSDLTLRLDDAIPNASAMTHHHSDSADALDSNQASQTLPLQNQEQQERIARISYDSSQLSTDIEESTNGRHTEHPQQLRPLAKAKAEKRMRLTAIVAGTSALFVVVVIGVSIIVLSAESWIDNVNSASSAPPPQEAPLLCSEDVDGWFDADGPTFNCSWYSQSAVRCQLHGNSSFLSNFGHTANTACCACEH